MSANATVSLSIKDVPERIVRELRARAERHHRSMQGELMNILETAVGPRPFDIKGLRREINALGLKPTPAESAAWIREDRER